MHSRVRRWAWPIAKTLLALAIIIAVAWQFWRDLHHESLHSLTIHWEWAVLSALLYVIGLGFACCYWHRLLVVFGDRPLFVTAVRAYYISQLGKYLPGKAWALIMRGTLIQGPEVRLSVALITTFYEVLTTMTSGALLAAVLFSFQQPLWLGGTWNAALAGVALAIVCGVPLLPGVFNRVVRLLKGRFQNVEGFKLPGVALGTLMEGLAITCGVWICFGLSLWAMVQGLLPQAEPPTVDDWARDTAVIGLACVAGFVAIVVPGGVGVREWLLDSLLAPELAAGAVLAAGPRTVIIVLLLRVAWTAGEVAMAALVWPLPRQRRVGA
jgi:glycosyltransferase 2 family protein